MLDCLLGLVGIKGRDSGSLAYVNSLPGISVQDFEQSVNNEARSAFERIDELTKLAIEEVVQDVQTYMAGKYELKTFTENDVIGYFQENQIVVPAQVGNQVGIYIKARLSPYLKLFIRRLRVQVQHTGTFDVKIWDMIQNKLLQTIPVTVVDGEITSIDIDFEYYTNKQYLSLFIGYESNFPSYKTNIVKFSENTYTSPWLDSWLFCAGRILSDGQTVLFQNSNPHSTTSGLSFDYSLQCSFDEKLCNIKKLLAKPIQYKVAALIAEDMKFSRRLNGVVTSYVDDFGVLADKYNGEYALRMNQLLQNMQQPNDNLCFCRVTRTETRTALP